MTKGGGYKLYWDSWTASMAPQMLLELAGLPYRPIRVSLAENEQRRPAYLALNPAGKVPTLVTPEGETLAEAAAICLWLAERHDLDLAPPPGDPDRATFLRWLLYLTDTIQPNYRRLYHTATYSDDPERPTPASMPPVWPHSIGTGTSWRRPSRLPAAPTFWAGAFPWLISSWSCW